MIYAVRQSCEGCQQTPPAGDVQCVREACYAICVCRPKAQSTTSFFADRSRIRKRTAHRAPASACCSSRQSTRRCYRCCICTLPTLCCMTLPAFAAASMAVNRRHRGAICSVCVGRVVRCACVAPELTTRRILFSLTGRVCSKKNNSTQSSRVNMLQ